jgi:hypothetical protein
MIGDTADMCNLAETHAGKTLFVPLNFWFNRFNGLALPLIALQYHDVRVTIQYSNGSECVNTDVGASTPAVKMDDSYLLIDYVYLDSEERKRFAQASHEYLIEQLQFTGSESLSSNTNKYRLNFNHPSKFLVWACHLDQFTAPTQYASYATDGNWTESLEEFAKKVWLAARVDASNSITVADPAVASNGSTLRTLADKVTAQLLTDEATLVDPDWEDVVVLASSLTSSDLSTPVSALVSGVGSNCGAAAWFNESGNSVVVQDWFNYGSNLNGTSNPVLSGKLQLNGHDRFQQREGAYFNYVQPYQHFSNTPADGINVYSFALKPEDIQPSGTCNFSRIDNATLNVQLNSGVLADSNSNLNIYTVNYNVLRVMSGMAGTAYSN